MKSLLKFYADTPRGDINKLFTFKVNNTADARAALRRFDRKLFRIRAAWYQTSPKSIHGFTNTRIL